MKFLDPIVVMHDHIYVVRDDYLPGGTKRRFIENYLRQQLEKGYKEFVYPSTAHGAAIVALGYAASSLKCNVTSVIAERKELSSSMKEAFDAGSGYLKFEYVKMGFYPKVVSFAKKYVNQKPFERDFLPCGFHFDYAIDAIAEIGTFLRKKHGQFDVLFSAASSGTLTLGLQKSQLAKEYFGVMTGMYCNHLGNAIPIKHYLVQKFEQNVKKEYKPPFPSYLNYDAKVWKYAKEYKDLNPDRSVLVWNVFAPNEEKLKYGSL